MMYLNKSNKLEHIIKPIQHFKADKTSLNRSIEIDGVSEDVFTKKYLYVIETKFRNKDTSIKVLEHLKESVSIFKGYKDVYYYLFSKTGFSEDIKHENGNVHLITLEEMMDAD